MKTQRAMTAEQASQRNRPLILAVILVVTLCALAAIVYQVFKLMDQPAAGELFFTVDDGKTWFTGPADNFPPFEHSGKTAYQAIVWACDGDKTKFVSHLIRYTPEGHKRIIELRRDPTPANMQDLPASTFTWREVKKPGAPETAWVAENSPLAQQIMQPEPPAGAATDLHRLRP